MMRKLLQITGCLLGVLVPLSVLAALPVTGTTMFDLFYKDAQQIVPHATPSERVADYIIEEMRSWGDRGIILTRDDVNRAVAGIVFTADNDGLCQAKVDTLGNPYTFAQGGDIVPGSCFALQSDILALIADELEAEQLGVDLLTIASSSELAIADEKQRPLDMALYTLLLRRVWSGTGSAVVPWDGTASAEFSALDANLSALSPDDLDVALLRFRNGVFRDAREADPRFAGRVDAIGDDLRAIAAKLRITGNPRATGIFAVPKLRVTNTALWARGDDIGLLPVYPQHIFRLSLKAASQYPVFTPNGTALAYPFSYAGAAPPQGPGISSPLCSRGMGRRGYLCRPLPTPETNCADTGNGSSITLVKCSEEVSVNHDGLSSCEGFDKLFTDNGVPLEDPDNSGHVNPALTKADVDTICSPGSRVLYPSDITSDACYISLCLKQSMNGHSLVPNRSPVVVNEATSPYLACMRQDPQLGLYTEIAVDSPYPLPEYVGQFLVRDFERQYCSKNGDAPQPLLGLCSFNDNENAALPIATSLVNVDVLQGLESALSKRADDFNSIATSIGQRASLDQSLELERKMLGKLAHFIQHIANLFLELKKAPLTQSMCPITGPFRASAP